MEHVEDPQRMLQLLSSELQPDGQLIFHVPCRSRRNVLKATRLVDERIGELMEHRCDGFTQSDLHTMVRNADLKIVSMRNTFARWVGGLAWEISTLAQRCAWCDNELGALLKPYVMATALAEAYLGIGRCWPGRGILLVAERAVE